MLFSTLDTTTRSLRLADTQEILLSDTVGFIRKLPHHLVEAFKSTLEEAKYADIIIHVVDASNPHQDTQMFVVYETLRQLGAEENRSLPYSTNRINWKHRDISGIFMQSTQSRFPQRQGRGWKN